MIRVAVAGAAGRMGETVCRAVEGADDLELTGRADPRLEVALADVLDEADVVVDFTVPDQALDNARACAARGVHVVIGTTGFEVDELSELEGANVFAAPNFAIGAVLMMRFAAQAARHMARAEIVELHHDRKLDRPSGTAARTARLMAEAAGGEEPPIHPSASPAWSPIRRSSWATWDRPSPSGTTPSTASRSCPACSSPSGGSPRSTARP